MPAATPKPLPRLDPTVAGLLGSLPPQDGRVAVVTGASGTLGASISRFLVLKGASVILAVRNPTKGEAIRQLLLAETPGARLHVARLDLTSLASIGAFANSLEDLVGRVDLLFANAGIMAVTRRVTNDGFESQMGVNHLGHYGLVGMLMPLLLEARAARVVSTTSGAAFAGSLDPGRLMELEPGDYNRWRAYSNSKLANILFSNALQRRFESAGVAARAHAAHPGYVLTDLQRNAVAESGSRLESLLLTRVAPLIGRSPQHGALPIVWAGLSEEARGGDLWGPRWFHAMGAPATKRQPGAARERGLQERLWQVSEELTCVRYPGPLRAG